MRAVGPGSRPCQASRGESAMCLAGVLWTRVWRDWPERVERFANAGLRERSASFHRAPHSSLLLPLSNTCVPNMEEPQHNISQDGALQRLVMWERGSVRNPHEMSFALNNLNATADIPCNASDRAGLWQLVQSTDVQNAQPFIVTER